MILIYKTDIFVFFEGDNLYFDNSKIKMSNSEFNIALDNYKKELESYEKTIDHAEKSIKEAKDKLKEATIKKHKLNMELFENWGNPEIEEKYIKFNLKFEEIQETYKKIQNLYFGIIETADNKLKESFNKVLVLFHEEIN